MSNTFEAIISEDGSTPAAPTPGEITPGQGRVAVAGAFAHSGGFRAAPRAGYATWRRMRGNPTLAMARMAAFAPVKVSPWSVEADDDVPQYVRTFVEQQVLPLRNGYLKHAAYALDYGFAAWEKVWRVAPFRKRRQQAWIIDKLKPLLVDRTTILVDPVTGSFAGLSNSDVQLDPVKSLVFTYDGEAGDFHGRPRNENIRRVWSAWEDALDRIGAQVNKVSGTTPIIEYPEGRSRDAEGNKVDNFDLVVQVLETLSRGKGVAMPNTVARWATQLVDRGVDPTKLKAWSIQFLDAKTGHIAESLGLLQHLEKLLVRGWLVPERAVTEATLAGSRADAASALDLALLIADDLATDLDETFSNYVINPIVLLNFGEEYRDRVRVRHQPLTDESRALMRGVIAKVLESPGNLELLMKVVDLDAELDRLGVARRRTEGEG